MSDGIDIGHGVTISWLEKDGQRVGLIEEHPAPGKTETGRCCGAVHFRGRPGANDGQPTWEVLSEDPLTLSPSLLCRSCGHHGFIREGRWVPA